MPNPILTGDLLRRFDVPGPRYTSYPTADRFVDAFGPTQFADALAQRAGGLAARVTPLALYVHLPFCESVCYYCACNKIVTRQHGRAAAYIDLLEREVELVVAQLGGDRPVSQLHLGGGTPTFLSDAELDRLMALLRRHFRFTPPAECSVEIDPRTVDTERLAHLKALGFGRLSFGVQDFDPAVQQAVHRVQPLDQVEALMVAARGLRFDSINLDLIYGLPRQTPASFVRTLASVQALRPDRIALYGYAHLPERFKPQRRIHAAELPDATAKVAMLKSALDTLASDSYTYIGMDHFALPDDALAVAKREGRLHRNFQGYTPHLDGDLIGLGVSAISRVGVCFAQNAKSLDDYEALLARGLLPTQRGLTLQRDDLTRQAVIMALMCQGHVVYEAVETAWLIDFRRHFASEMAQLESLAEAGLVVCDDTGIQVTPRGWYVVRAIAMVFDRHLQADRQRARFSRIL